jgi:hypothetical protein
MVDRVGLDANDVCLDEAIDIGPTAETDSVLWQRVCQACIDSYLVPEQEFDWWWRAPVEWQGEPLDEVDGVLSIAAPAAPAAAEEDPAPTCEKCGHADDHLFTHFDGVVNCYDCSLTPGPRCPRTHADCCALCRVTYEHEDEEAPGEPDYTNMEALD